MLQKLHYSSTIQIHTKIQVQFQELKEFKYGLPAYIDNEKLLICSATPVPHLLIFFCRSQQI